MIDICTGEVELTITTLELVVVTPPIVRVQDTEACTSVISEGSTIFRIESLFIIELGVSSQVYVVGVYKAS